MSNYTTRIRWIFALSALLAAIGFLCFPFLALAQQTATLTWTQNTEADLAGYEFHRAFIDCNAPNAATLLQPHVKVGKVGTYTETLPAGTKIVCYALKAFDTSNNFSALSNLAGKVFPVTPTLLGHWDKKTDVPNDPKYNIKTFTIHGLVRPKAPLVGFAPLFVRNYTYFLYASSTGYCGAGAPLTGGAVTSERPCDPTPVPEQVWTSLTATYDGTTITLYRNKTVVGTKPMLPPPDSTETIQIGGSKFNELCNCDLEVWLYEGAMTATAVAALPQAPTPAVIQVTPSVLSFTRAVGQPDPASQTVAVANVGAGTLIWAASANQPWVTVSPADGTGPGTLTVSVARGALPVGTHLANITVTATDAQPVTIAVTFKVEADVTPPLPPTNFRLSERPSAATALLAWVQPGGQPESYRVDRFLNTAWVEDKRVPGAVTQTEVLLPEVGRRQYRICAMQNAALLCNNREGVWIAR